VWLAIIPCYGVVLVILLQHSILAKLQADVKMLKTSMTDYMIYHHISSINSINNNNSMVSYIITCGVTR